MKDLIKKRAESLGFRYEEMEHGSSAGTEYGVRLFERNNKVLAEAFCKTLEEAREYVWGWIIERGLLDISHYPIGESTVFSYPK
jgi:hypothetical protein